MISGTLTGLFFKSTSGMKKCARGGLVSNFSWKFMEIIVICILSDWIWIKCSLGAGFEEARNSSAFHLIFQLLGQRLHRIIIKHKISILSSSYLVWMWYWEYSDLVIILDNDSSATKFVLAEFISIQNFSNLDSYNNVDILTGFRSFIDCLQWNIDIDYVTNKRLKFIQKIQYFRGQDVQQRMSSLHRQYAQWSQRKRFGELFQEIWQT